MISESSPGARARRVFAEDLATELDLDMSPEFMSAADRLLARLYLSGYVVVPISDEVRQDNTPDV